MFWKAFTVKGTDDERELEAVERRVPFLRHYTLFNVAQCEGLAMPPLEGVESSRLQPLDACERFVASTGAKIRYGVRGVAAYRRRPQDDIVMPPFEWFTSPEAYYATLFHELIHWTGDDSRCPRPFGRRFGDPDYAREELVAELGSAFLCQRLLVDGMLQHPEYMSAWLKVLKADKRAIFQATSKARAACAFLLREGDAAPA